MPIRKPLLLALLFSVLLAAPASAKFTVGIGDQNAGIFQQPDFQALEIKRVRYLVPYDWYKDAGQNSEVVGFMNAAQAAGADVLVHFTARRGCYLPSGKYSRSKVCKAPSVATYKRAFKRFRKAYPFVTTYGAWNEGNHVSQPVYRNPKLAARYFLAMRSVCPKCKIVAADVLDTSNMRSWLRTFLKKAKGKAKIFGLHNYQDVNRRTTDGTRALLRTVKGQVWLTETGGILTFLPSFKTSETRQANRTRNMFKLVDRYDTRRKGMKSRITRLYNYQYTGSPAGARFDAGLVNADWTPRKAYDVFKSLAAKHRR